jgi:F-type H+-transporting ATPase subunit a
VLEPLVLYVRDEIARPNIGEKKYKKFMPYLLTVFFFIWILNLLGLTPLGFNVTGNIAVTLCLALFTFIIVQFSANKEYWGHIFWMPGVPVIMKIILAPIEVLGMFTKPFSYYSWSLCVDEFDCINDYDESCFWSSCFYGYVIITFHIYFCY